MSNSKMTVDKSQPKKMVQGLDAAYFALGHVAGHARHTHELFAERIEALDSKIEEKKQERLKVLKVLVELGVPDCILSDEEYLTGENAYDWPIPNPYQVFEQDIKEHIDNAIKMVKEIRGLQYQSERLRVTKDNPYLQTIFTSDDEHHAVLKFSFKAYTLKTQESSEVTMAKGEAEAKESSGSTKHEPSIERHVPGPSDEKGFRSSIGVIERKLAEAKKEVQEVREKLDEQYDKLLKLHDELVNLVFKRNKLAKKANWINSHVEKVQELASKLVKISLSNGTLDQIGPSNSYSEETESYFGETDSYSELDPDSELDSDPESDGASESE